MKLCAFERGEKTRQGALKPAPFQRNPAPSEAPENRSRTTVFRELRENDASDDFNFSGIGTSVKKHFRIRWAYCNLNGGKEPKLKNDKNS